MTSRVALRSSGVSSPARPPMLIPSNGRPAMNRADSSRSSGSRPPWTIPNSAWSVRVCASRDRSAQRCVLRIASSTTARGELGNTGWSNATATSGPERLLHGDGVLRREAVDRPVEMALEGHAAVVDHAQVAERDDLEAAGVREDRAVPAHEAVEAAEIPDALVARAQVEVVGVGEDDRGAGGGDLVRVERLDGGIGAHGHELRRLDHPVRQLEATQARARGPVRGRRDEDLEAGGAGHGQRAGRSSQRAGISGSARRGAGIS